jgi:hypothetical protein
VCVRSAENPITLSGSQAGPTVNLMSPLSPSIGYSLEHVCIYIYICICIRICIGSGANHGFGVPLYYCKTLQWHIDLGVLNKLSNVNFCLVHGLWKINLCFNHGLWRIYFWLFLMGCGELTFASFMGCGELALGFSNAWAVEN